MSLVTVGDLEQWGQTTIARHKLPELLKYLIHDTLSLQDIKYMRFIQDEASDLKGWDGILNCFSQIFFVPSGYSVWELGTGNNPRGKILRDFKSKIDEDLPEGWKHENTTYIAVTLNKLDKLTVLEKELNVGSPWKEVKIYDAQTISDWLENRTAAQTWLQEQDVGRSPSIRTLKRSWDLWSRGTNPELSENLLIIDREVKVKDFIEALKVGGLINIKADSPEEAIAFIFSAINNSDLILSEHFLSRSVVINNSDDATSLLEKDAQIVILSPPATDQSQLLANAGHTVVNALGNSSRNRKTNLILNRPLRSNFQKELVNMGLNEEEASAEARACGSSPAIWRVWNNLKQGDYSSEIPNWAKPENSKLVIPAILLGGWSEKSKGDIEIVEKITGYEYSKYRDLIEPFLSDDNPLFIKYDDEWYVNAPATSFVLITNQITTGNLESIATIAKIVFSEIDPTVSLEPDDRPFVQIKTEGMIHSRLLRDGLSETLLRIVVLGEELEQYGKIPSSQTRQTFVDNLIRKLPGLSSDYRLLASLRDQLPVLAEASPDPLLEALEKMIQGDPESLSPIFEQGDSFYGHTLSPGILWSLETLAWDSKYLSRVILILVQLAKIDPGGNLSNRPINSLKEIFIPWHPGTSASLSERLQAIDLILEREPEIGWILLDLLLPTHSSISHNTNKPIWKDFGRSDIKPITNKEVSICYTELTNKAIKYAGTYTNRWVTLIDKYQNLPKSYQDKIENGLQYLLETDLSKNDKYVIWERLRKFISHHRTFPNASWSLPEERLENLEVIMNSYSPEDKIDNIAWLFNEHYPDIPNPSSDHTVNEKELNNLRKQSVNTVCNNDNYTDKEIIENLLKLINVVSIPSLISPYLIECIKNIDDSMKIFQSTVNGNEKEIQFSKYHSLESYKKFGEEWTQLVIAKGKENEWPIDLLVNAFLYYPDRLETYQFINSLGIEADNSYWTRKDNWIRVDSKELAKLIFQKLLSVGRSLDVIGLGLNLLSKLESSELIDLLDKAISDLNEGKSSIYKNQIDFVIEELFKILRERDDIDIFTLAKLEYCYIPILRTYSEKNYLGIHELLSTDAAFFVDLICDIYKPATKDETTTEPTKEQIKKADIGWQLLNSWNNPPGVGENNIVDGELLNEWVKKVRELANEKDRIDIADHKIGTILSYYPIDPTDHIWPHIELRKLLEELNNEIIEKGIESEQYNSRGTTTRALFDGGNQERELAKKWNDWTIALGSRWPRTRNMLERIAKNWENEANRMDTESKKRRQKYY